MTSPITPETLTSYLQTAQAMVPLKQLEEEFKTSRKVLNPMLYALAAEGKLAKTCEPGGGNPQWGVPEYAPKVVGPQVAPIGADTAAIAQLQEQLAAVTVTPLQPAPRMVHPAAYGYIHAMGGPDPTGVDPTAGILPQEQPVGTAPLPAPKVELRQVHPTTMGYIDVVHQPQLPMVPQGYYMPPMGYPQYQYAPVPVPPAPIVAPNKPTKATEASVLAFLTQQKALGPDPAPTLAIAKFACGPKASCKFINPTLYALQKKGLVTKTANPNGSEPKWKLAV